MSAARFKYIHMLKPGAFVCVADRDVVILSRVLYHLEDMAMFLMKAIKKSTVKVIILQGNRKREKHIKDKDHLVEDSLCNVYGMTRLLDRFGFGTEEKTEYGNKYPIVIGKR